MTMITSYNAIGYTPAPDLLSELLNAQMRVGKVYVQGSDVWLDS